jgi:hypothetical protein
VQWRAHSFVQGYGRGSGLHPCRQCGKVRGATGANGWLRCGGGVEARWRHAWRAAGLSTPHYMCAMACASSKRSAWQSFSTHSALRHGTFQPFGADNGVAWAVTRRALCGQRGRDIICPRGHGRSRRAALHTDRRAPLLGASFSSRMTAVLALPLLEYRSLSPGLPPAGDGAMLPPAPPGWYRRGRAPASPSLLSYPFANGLPAASDACTPPPRTLCAGVTLCTGVEADESARSSRLSVARP